MFNERGYVFEFLCAKIKRYSCINALLAGNARKDTNTLNNETPHVGFFVVDSNSGQGKTRVPTGFKGSASKVKVFQDVWEP